MGSDFKYGGFYTETVVVWVVKSMAVYAGQHEWAAK